MIFEEILAAIRTEKFSNFNPDTSPMLLSMAYSRGPQPNGSLISIKSTLKERELDPTAQPHVVFVIDKSGSMQGINYLAALEVFQSVYRAISDATYVSIILFNNTVETLSIPLSTGTSSVRALKSEINKIALDSVLKKTPQGGTNIIGALKATAAIISQSSDTQPTEAQINDASIIFITDGIDNHFAQYTSESSSARSAALPPSSTAREEPPKPSVELMLQVLKREMEKNYGGNHFARIMPIGIGVKYDDQLLMGIGDDPTFHRMGFLHVSSLYDVANEQSALAATVDPLRLRTQIFIAYQDGSHELYPAVYLQRGAGAGKQYLLDSTTISEIYLVQEQDATHHEITRIVSAVPSLESIPYNEQLLHQFLIAENAGITNAYVKCTDKAKEYPILLNKITFLLSTYTEEYWSRDKLATEALENLNRIYTQISDAIHNRPYVREISALEAQSFFHRADRDELLRHASASAREAVSCLAPTASGPYAVRY